MLDHENFFYQQNQGRFIPSFQNPRNGFFPPGALPRPGSYQEQTLFVGSTANDEDSTPSYFQQFQPFTVSSLTFFFLYNKNHLLIKSKVDWNINVLC